MSQSNQPEGAWGSNGFSRGLDEESVGADRQESREQTRTSRRPRREREDAFDVGAWLLEGLTGLSGELRHNDLGLPEDFWTHAYAARREALLAAKALVDAALERCGEQESDAAAKKKKAPQRGQVSIDFD